MPRSTELIRQWQILRSLDVTPTGVTIRRLASERKVSERTIRRDLEALEQAGFPIYCDRANGTALYRFTNKPFRKLAALGLGLSEAAALYLSRAMIEGLASTPLREDLSRALDKIEDALPEGVRKHLSDLPGLLHAKLEPAKRRDERRMRELIPRIVGSALERKRVSMTYHSFSSRRVKTYVVEPQRLTYAQGGIYLAAFVPEYGQVRTFAVERIRTYAETGERFDRRARLSDKPFKNSLGVHTGDPVRVEVEFDARIAPYVKERDWHASQQVEERPDGSVLVRLDVCVDPPLRSWILSFGPLARVIAPRALAEEILEELDEAREKYAPRMAFEPPGMPLYSPSPGPRLPFPRPA